MSQVSSNTKNVLQGIALSMNSKIATLTDEDVKSVTAVMIINDDTTVTVKDVDANENVLILKRGMILVIADDVVSMTTSADVFID